MNAKRSISLMNATDDAQVKARFAMPELRLPASRRRVLILGTDKLARELGHLLVSERSFRYELVGFLDRHADHVNERLLHPGLIGSFDQLSEAVEQRRVNTIVVCLDDRRGGLPLQTLLDFKAMGIEVFDGHQLYEQESGRLSIDLLKPSSLIFSTGFQRRKLTMSVKRCMDVIVALLGLVALVPVMAIVSLLIKLDSSGPVFYRQTRVGRQGDPYEIWKFRSMRLDAESEGARWAIAGDPRVTRLGRWLRKWRIDEIPQLMNVLKGEMALVGPRPERPIFVQELRTAIPYYDLRYTVRPGLTGWAQTRFRYAGSGEDSHIKFQYDLYYLKNLSLLLDIRILFQTIKVVSLGEGAR